jgi:hypothetical protein
MDKDANPIPSHVNYKIFQNSKTIRVECHDIETINFKNRNPQVNLMGSNPNSPKNLRLYAY